MKDQHNLLYNNNMRPIHKFVLSSRGKAKHYIKTKYEVEAVKVLQTDTHIWIKPKSIGYVIYEHTNGSLLILWPKAGNNGIESLHNPEDVKRTGYPGKLFDLN